MPEHHLDKLKAFLKSNPSQQELDAWLNTLPLEDRCECILYIVRNSPTTFVRVPQPAFAFQNPERLTDAELFKEIAKAIEDTTLIKDGKLSCVNPRENPEPGNRFASLINEAVRRGFTRDDIHHGTSPYLDEAEKLTSFFADPVWRRFERLVARIHEALCREADVQLSESLLDSSGRPRQVDVTIRQNIGPHPTLLIVECKKEKRPVSIQEVEAFITKKSSLKADLAIMVSSSGYQEGARAAAAQYNVRLWTLEEAEKASWREELRVTEITLPMWDRIDIEPSPPREVLADGNGFDLGEISVYTKGTRQTLAQLAARAIKEIVGRDMPIPAVIDFFADEGDTISFKNHSFPLRRLRFIFNHRVVLERTRKMRVPTGIVYRFSSVDGKASFTLSEADLEQPGS